MISDTTWLFPVAAIQAVLLGVIASEIARLSGPKSVKLASIVATALSFILGIVLSTPATLVACAAGYAVLTMLFSYWYGEKIVAAGIRKQIEMAPEVVRFALRNYSRFADKDGITSAGLHSAIDEGGQFSADDMALVNNLLWHMSDIGHVVDTVILSTPAIMHGGAHAVAIYAANERDLRTYEARLKQKYAAWLVA